MMARAAGLTSVKEPLGLLPDSVEERPGDWYITGWKIKGVKESNHAMELTLPLTDSQWDNLIADVKAERATMVGSTGYHSETKKRQKVGTAGEQRARGNDHTMTERCQQQNIHFWPVALEGDGVPTENFLSYINHVCDAAQKLKGVNRGTFKSYFLSRIANTLHQVSARLAIRQTSACRARLVHQHGPADTVDE